MREGVFKIFIILRGFTRNLSNIHLNLGLSIPLLYFICRRDLHTHTPANHIKYYCATRMAAQLMRGILNYNHRTHSGYFLIICYFCYKMGAWIIIKMSNNSYGSCQDLKQKTPVHCLWIFLDAIAISFSNIKKIFS